MNDVMAVHVLSRYVVELTFESGDVRVLDLEPLLTGEVFEPLTAEYELFKQVRVERLSRPSWKLRERSPA
jgi:hypothetical protein